MKISNDNIKLWTIQSPLAFSILQEKGVLRADGRKSGKNYHGAYRWMMEQMKKRLPNYKGYFPLWCWFTPKPDLRRRAHLMPGQKGVRIEFITNSENVLMSDFDSWHFVLNNQYLALCEEEIIDNTIKNKIDTWERIFDIEKLNNSELTAPVENIQAVVEEIFIHQVISVQEFTAR